MKPVIVQLDFSKIENEIQEKTLAIDKLKEELLILEKVRSYIELLQSKPEEKPKIENNFNIELPKGQHQISEFIINLLNNGPLETKEITDSYAKFLGKSPVEVRNNVNNALNRLKNKGKVEAQVLAEGRSSTWFVKNINKSIPLNSFLIQTAR